MENAEKIVNKLFIKALKMWIFKKIAFIVDNLLSFAHKYAYFIHIFLMLIMALIKRF
ncbi:hypothetical protein HMPREF3216_00831 [Gardnerella vaginalis]|uniref:Uncharacterized protein n=1 Tax=Gardnerella vaginalis TaxID=2702 RepID=A0A133NP36_GARVA|nr:hypothetical protein HMPREF3216_00831 [Gardnerella vaginalis]